MTDPARTFTAVEFMHNHELCDACVAYELKLQQVEAEQAQQYAADLAATVVKLKLEAQIAQQAEQIAQIRAAIDGGYVGRRMVDEIRAILDAPDRET